MVDGFETVRAAVDDRSIIRKLNISTLFSSTDGEVQYDRPLETKTYKGLFISGKPRPMVDGEVGRYWINLRGSLIKAANNGVHNKNALDPFALLAVLDDLATTLGIDPFNTPICGLELSATVSTDNPTQIRDNMLSYLNRRPNFDSIEDEGLRLPYAEVEAGQHKVKLYSPTPGALRFEIKVAKMQFLGQNRPQFLADLTNPDYLPALAAKLLKAFDRIMWKCPIADLDVLTTDECMLYLQGRDYTYWQVRPQDYDTRKEFRRQEKNRQREKEAYNALINRHWQGELPARVRQRIEDQLNQYIDISHSGLYHTARELCIERWQLVRHLPPSS